MEEAKVYNSQSFLDSELLIKFPSHIKELISNLIAALVKQGIEFSIKVRKDKAIVFTLTNNIQKNLCTVWVFSKHIMLRIAGQYERKITAIEDIDEELISTMIDKYQAISTPKKQISIYMDETLLKKIEDLAQRENKKTNDVIVSAIQETFRDSFISTRHKIEFATFIKSANLYSQDDKYIHGLDDKTRKTVAFFYLIAAYQEECFELNGEKFSYDITKNALVGPTHLIREWELGVADCETMLGLGLFLLKGKESGIELADILHYLTSTETMHLALTAFKIVGGQLTLSRDNIINTESLIIVQPDDDPWVW